MFGASAALARRTVPSALLLAAVLVLFGGRLALAAFTSDGQSSGTVGTATLAAPKSPSAAQINCQRNGAVEVGLAWSPTSSTYATSYTVERSTSAGGSYTTLASLPVGTGMYTDTSSTLATSTTYYYRVSALYMSWSATVQASLTTFNKQCR
jgi:hypothetical protein